MEALRDALGKALVAAGHRHPDLVVVSCDVRTATRVQGFFKEFPRRSFEVGIAEANGVGIATGLALAGLRPFLTSFSAFITGKNVEIRSSIAYNRAPVVVVGTHGGLIGPDGATHAGLQDIAVMRSIPGMRVFQPATPLETRAMVEHLAGDRHMAYLRIGREVVPELLEPGYQFVPGRGVVLREGIDLALISSGSLVHVALAAAEQLSRERDLSIRVVNLPSLKPVDRSLIQRCVEETGLVVTVEDHDVSGGLGSIVAEVVGECPAPCQVHRHGLADVFISSATPEELARIHRLDAAGVAAVVLAVWDKHGGPRRKAHRPG
ncbi:MAG: transketolase family protein [Candidatus Riflebacteria bacterium]|nr:transketolase family protein [Candidatus Riflebacteria bacterium]